MGVPAAPGVGLAWSERVAVADACTVVTMEAVAPTVGLSCAGTSAVAVTTVVAVVAVAAPVPVAVVGVITGLVVRGVALGVIRGAGVAVGVGGGYIGVPAGWEAGPGKADAEVLTALYTGWGEKSGLTIAK